MLDWIDTNIDVTGADGAEDDFYTGQTPSYRAANGLMVSPSELLLVRGFRVTDEGGLDDYDVLLPHIATLPQGTAININTASSAVLSSLAPYMPAIADELKVVDDGYWQEFPECPEGGGLLDSLLNAGIDEEIFIDVKSQYYMSRVTVKREEITLTQFTILERDNNGALRTLRRSRGGL